MPQLLNNAAALGTFQTVPINADTQAVVELNAIEMTKTPERLIWLTGNLGYTITVQNLDDTDPGDPVENLVVTDVIDPEIASYVDGTAVVTIGGEPVVGATVDFNADTGLLTVSVGTLPAGETVTIYFLVEKKDE